MSKPDKLGFKLAYEAIDLAEQIAPLLHGRDEGVQGAALADLLATWLAGHFVIDNAKETTKLRAQLLRQHIEAVRYLIPVNEEKLLERVKREAN